MKKVVVIDDDRDIVGLVTDILTELPYEMEVCPAYTGNDGIELIQKEMPDLCIVDIYLPDTDGLHVCSMIKTDPETMHIPVLIMTGVKVDTQWYHKAMAAGAELFIEKPFHIQHFIAQANTLIRLKKAEENLRQQRVSLERRLMEQSQELVDSEQLFLLFMRQINGMVYIKNEEGKYLFINRNFKEMINGQAWVGKSARELFSQNVYEDIVSHEKITIETGDCVYEQPIEQDGKTVILENHKFRIERSNGAYFIGGIAFDITRRKQISELIEKSLREKEILLMEVHHRVKNNMQVISSLLRMQSSYIHDEKDRQLFVESQNRVRSMALIHERLYKADDLMGIDLKHYVSQLLSQLHATYSPRHTCVRHQIEIIDVRLGLDTAIPLGLVINEIISNAYKYAFAGCSQGLIFIRMHETEETYELIIGDDGVGLKESVTLASGGNLGFQIIDSLSAQLHADVHIDRSAGTRFTIRFPKELLAQ
jgi:PAS domain S-box-containing protein